MNQLNRNNQLLSKYEVTMTVENGISSAKDHEIKKKVIDYNEDSAVQQAKQLVKDENHEINSAKIWTWSTEKSDIDINVL